MLSKVNEATNGATEKIFGWERESTGENTSDGEHIDASGGRGPKDTANEGEIACDELRRRGATHGKGGLVIFDESGIAGHVHGGVLVSKFFRGSGRKGRRCKCEK